MTPPPSILFPLSGEWYVGADGTEPGHELAFDFMRLDKHLKATRRAAWQELLLAVPYGDYHGWGQPILSPFKGKVVTAVDGCPESPKSYLSKLLGSVRSLYSPRDKRRLEDLSASQSGDIREFAGNHLVIESLEHSGVFAFLAHARLGSLKCAAGDVVNALQAVAEVGDSGQSMLPHLHFHLMASPNPLTQRLIPFKFSTFEANIDGDWLIQRDTLPTRRQRVRSVA
ncbi:M23 family metallopeptidase [Aquabacterium humicola]|uniref:M23 family metallopeptidase n=1 Tax=Aquabacterium humicola TaxID=3237377 RepID=UPI002542C80C|nr:M23 family metallopeptidase [Rubrivivax pictus]